MEFITRDFPTDSSMLMIFILKDLNRKKVKQKKMKSNTMNLMNILTAEMRVWWQRYYDEFTRQLFVFKFENEEARKVISRSTIQSEKFWVKNRNFSTSFWDLLKINSKFFGKLKISSENQHEFPKVILQMLHEFTQKFTQPQDIWYLSGKMKVFFILLKEKRLQLIIVTLKRRQFFSPFLSRFLSNQTFSL